MNIAPRSTILCDIDGTLVVHKETLEQMLVGDMDILPGVLDTIDSWIQNDCLIFLITARPESSRSITVHQLAKAGIRYHQLIMGATNGHRIIINDTKPTDRFTADSFIVDRNSGFPS